MDAPEHQDSTRSTDRQAINDAKVELIEIIMIWDALRGLADDAPQLGWMRGQIEVGLRDARTLLQRLDDIGDVSN
ncbi:MAG TPA: hypothetical protein VGF69_09600 [Thermoanaerobaculia bacterium]|jgi:hypothetical protein